jgi:DNA polymerase-3 subunit alpha
MVKELLQHTGKNVTIFGLFVAPKDVNTKYGEHMAFAAFLDVNGDYFDTTHFPEQLAKHPLNGAGVYVIHGKAVQELGYPSIEVKWIEKLPLIPDPRY